MFSYTVKGLFALSVVGIFGRIFYNYEISRQKWDAEDRRDRSNYFKYLLKYHPQLYIAESGLRYSD